MKNVSLYIAKRYNTNTLIISMVLIIISTFFVGSLIYITNLSVETIHAFLFQNKIQTIGGDILIYGASIAYLIVQSVLIYLIFNKLLNRVSGRFKLITTIIISFVSFVSVGIIIYLNLDKQFIFRFINLILISSGLLSLTFGLLSFIFSNRKITGVNIITSIAVFAITIATCALFIILSVFSGLEKMNNLFFINVNPDIKISAAKGKTLPDIENLTQKLGQNQYIESYAKVIEEKVSIEFGDKQDIAYIKGIGENYKNVVRIDTTLVAGNFFDFKTPYEIIASDGVARRLQLYVDKQNGARLRMPRPGTGLISSESEAFNSVVANPVGVMFINEQYDKYIFSPIGLTQILLELPESSAYYFEVKLNPEFSAETVKPLLQKELGNQVKVETRRDLDATFIKVMNIENLIIYLIFTLVTIIASFNLAGAIIIIIIDKKQQIKSMWSFGLSRAQIKKIFFQTGLLITSFSILFGLLLGVFIGFLQIKFSLVMANAVVPFPFEFTLMNFFAVIFTVLAIGGGASYLVSRKLPV